MEDLDLHDMSIVNASMLARSSNHSLMYVLMQNRPGFECEMTEPSDDVTRLGDISIKTIVIAI